MSTKDAYDLKAFFIDPVTLEITKVKKGGNTTQHLFDHPEETPQPLRSKSTVNQPATTQEEEEVTSRPTPRVIHPMHR